MSIQDQIVAEAKSLPDLIAAAQAVDPNLAASLTPKSLVGSKTAILPLVTWAVAAAASHYGLGWDEGTSATVASAVSYLVLLGVRTVTRSPIGSILPVT